jgi:uncharacterized repeat protein (TIGR03803 family)
MLVALLMAIGLLLPAAQAQNFQVIHNFTGGDGALPAAGLTLDKAGNLYGTTFGAGFGPHGNVYQLKRKGGTWIFNILYTFHGSDGSLPLAGVTFGSDGSLFGTTNEGGGSGCNGRGCGTVFNLRPPPSACKTALCPWTETVLYSFAGPPDDGADPAFGDLIFDDAGNLWGTTANGGSHSSGTVYTLTPSSSGWTETLLYSFANSPDGAIPLNGLIFDDVGNLYSTTLNGGQSGYGAVFQMKDSGKGWAESLLYSFDDGSNGGYPYAGLVSDQVGNLYGATTDGGSGGGGTVFELSPSGGGWTLQTLYSFAGSHQCGPTNISMDEAGNLYGTTFCDGTNGYGNVWELARSGSGWVYKDLYDFTGASDGANPNGTVTVDANGNLYGTTYYGGEQNLGVVWEITP